MKRAKGKRVSPLVLLVAGGALLLWYLLHRASGGAAADTSGTGGFLYTHGEQVGQSGSAYGGATDTSPPVTTPPASHGAVSAGLSLDSAYPFPARTKGAHPGAPPTPTITPGAGVNAS